MASTSKMERRSAETKKSSYVGGGFPRFVLICYLLNLRTVVVVVLVLVVVYYETDRHRVKSIDTTLDAPVFILISHSLPRFPSVEKKVVLAAPALLGWEISHPVGMKTRGGKLLHALAQRSKIWVHAELVSACSWTHCTHACIVQQVGQLL